MVVPHPPRILVVDDEAMVLFTLQLLLQRHGYAVTTAPNGSEALALILRDRFDLLLIDLKLPGISGLEIARYACEHQPQAGIIILTGSDEVGGVAVEEQVAPFDCIVKTASPQEVLERVHSMVFVERTTATSL
jgi:DNA-binding response OmpR family regulator